MNRLLDWLNDKFLPWYVAFLLIFIPLFPKWPLFDVSHTWVYIRREDLLIALAVIVWGLLWIKKKIKFPSAITLPIFLYWSIGLASTIFAIIFIFPTIANVFPMVAIFHFLRRIEYLVLLFVAAATIKKAGDLNKYIVALGIAATGVLLYGIGQKLGGLPAYLTMNEEFAKGIPLYLPEGARITSTFGGHYDLAAYLVMMIALFFSLFFGAKRILAKLILLALSIGSLVVLLFTASRVSFAVYLLTVIFMLLLQKKKLLIIPVIILSLLLLAQVRGTWERFAKTIRIQPIVVNTKTGQPVAVLEKLPPEISGLKPTPTPQQPEETLPLGSGFIGLPQVSESPEATSVAVIRRSISQSLRVSTVSSEISTISGSFLIQKAFVYDISFTTRFQGGWPRAWKAFQRNILLGSGYSSIDLASDNDYLRILGETGVLGFISFLFIFSTYYLILRKNWEALKSPWEKSFVIGVTAGIFGLFLNAILIDVFEASKVAQVLWLLVGLSLGVIYLHAKNKVNLLKDTFNLITSNLFLACYLLLLSFYAFSPILTNYFTGPDFPILKAMADVKINDFWNYFLQGGASFQPLTKFLYFSLYSVFWLKSFGYHLTSIFLYFVIVFFVLLIFEKLSRKKVLAFSGAVLFLFFPLNHQIVASIANFHILLSTLFILVSFYFFLARKQQSYFSAVGFSLLSYIIGLITFESVLILPLLVVAGGVITERKKFLKERNNILIFFLFALITVEYFLIRGAFIEKNLLPDLSWGWYILLLPVIVLPLVLNLLDKFLQIIFKNRKNTRRLFFLSPILILIFLSKAQLDRELSNWYKASEAGKKIIYAIKDNYKIFPPGSALYFANLPKKVGNATVYETGLGETLWFIYRDDTLQVNTVSKKKDLPEFADSQANIYRFVFEDNQLRFVTQE